LITGASRGIGEATARHLVECGSKVVLCARTRTDIDRIAEELGDAALSVQCDVSDYGQVQAAVTMAIDRFGGINLLVNNAGTIEPIARIEDSDPAAWSSVVDVNLKGVYHCMHAVHGVMHANGGVIVNISSGAASNALEGWSHYCATKAGVLAMTRCAHKEWAHQGIRVVGLTPGTVATDMQVAIRDSKINPVSELDWDKHISPQWVARAIVWLTQDEADSYAGTDFSIKTDEGRRAVGLI
jgi:NAD(P)-dependent dehydrogenase (short-subunit alcohol dehydrogenase family)